jgi:hypothetical protein
MLERPDGTERRRKTGRKKGYGEWPERLPGEEAKSAAHARRVRSTDEPSTCRREMNPDTTQWETAMTSLTSNGTLEPVNR